MNYVILVCGLLTVVSAAVIPDESQAQILRYDNENDGAGNYAFNYETSNGIRRNENGRLVNAGTDDEHIVVDGSYSYTDPEGNLVLVTYTADENGYRVNEQPQVVSMVQYGLPANVVASLLG